MVTCSACTGARTTDFFDPSRGATTPPGANSTVDPPPGSGIERPSSAPNGGAPGTPATNNPIRPSVPLDPVTPGGPPTTDPSEPPNTPPRTDPPPPTVPPISPPRTDPTDPPPDLPPGPPEPGFPPNPPAPPGPGFPPSPPAPPVIGPHLPQPRPDNPASYCSSGPNHEPEFCDESNPICCFDRTRHTYSCTGAGECEGAPILCATTAECSQSPSTPLCCAHFRPIAGMASGGQFIDIQCRATCTEVTNDRIEIVLCETPGSLNECPPNTRCKASTALVGFNGCFAP